MSNIQYIKLKEIVSNILREQNIKIEDLGITSKEFNDDKTPCFDMALIKKLGGSNTSEKGDTSGNQSSIILTGEQSAIFPCIKRSEFYGEVVGRNMVLKFNLKLMKNNMLYLKNKEYHEDNEVVESYIITNEATAERIEVGCKTLDGEDYVDFYESLTADSFLIVLKLRSRFEYIILAVKYSDSSKYFIGLEVEGKKLYYFYKINKITKNSKEDVTYIDTDNIIVTSPKINIGYNRLVYGAPGTGKSNLLERDRKIYFGNNYERVTFYSDYSYGQFVGMYKPTSKNGTIQYTFVPGPFLRVLVNALKFKEENYLIIIEEINRANAAAVFGDMFQLLDRNSNGLGEYAISLGEEVVDYLKKERLDIKELKLPSNFFIWATMNSADQGVVPLDAAFKRRFDDYKLMGIDENEDKLNGINVNILCDSIGEIGWNEFRKGLNKLLINKYNVKEDKLIGPFFIKPSVLENNEKFQLAFKDKLLMYLAEDVLRHKKKEFFGKSSLSEILSNYKKDGLLFPNEFLNEIRRGTKDE